MWLGLLLLVRISSVAGMTAALSAPVSAAIFGERLLFPMFLGFALLVIWKHKENIVRLRAGKEPKVGSKDQVSDDLVDRLRLVRSPGIGPVTYRQLIARFGSASAALDAVPDLAARGGGRAPRLASRRDAEREIARVEALGGRYLSLGQGLYPRALAELDDAPPLLTVKGDVRLLDKPLVAIVGARNASAAACRFARQLAYDLGQQGAVVVSGLARGIDSAAHDGSLETGTIGVVAGGLDIFYPPENEARQKAMFERGLVIAEMPPGTEPSGAALPLSQPDHRGPDLGHGRRRGGAQVRLADHRAARRGSGPRGHGRSRVRRSIRARRAATS